MGLLIDGTNNVIKKFKYILKEESYDEIIINGTASFSTTVPEDAINYYIYSEYYSSKGNKHIGQTTEEVGTSYHLFSAPDGDHMGVTVSFSENNMILSGGSDGGDITLKNISIKFLFSTSKMVIQGDTTINGTLNTTGNVSIKTMTGGNVSIKTMSGGELSIDTQKGSSVTKISNVESGNIEINTIESDSLIKIKNFYGSLTIENPINIDEIPGSTNSMTTTLSATDGRGKIIIVKLKNQEGWYGGLFFWDPNLGGPNPKGLSMISTPSICYIEAWPQDNDGNSVAWSSATQIEFELRDRGGTPQAIGESFIKILPITFNINGW